MAAIVREGIAAGALGFTTSRTLLHRAIDGEPVPGTFAARRRAARHRPRARRASAAACSSWRRDLDARGARARLDGARVARRPDGRSRSRAAERRRSRPVAPAARRGRARPRRAARTLVPQVAARPTSLLLGLAGHAASRSSRHADATASSRTCRSPSASRALRDPETKRRILAEQRRRSTARSSAYLATAFHKLFPLGDPPDYEPAAEASVAAIARARAAHAAGGRLRPAARARRPRAALPPAPQLLGLRLRARSARCSCIRAPCIGLADGGAHCGVICDASMPTFLLTHWVRDRQRGARLPLEQVVRRQTRDTARALRPARPRRARARA